MSGDQEEVYGPNFLLKAGRKGDLIIRLNALHKSLHELTQDPNDLPSGLQATAAQLVSVKVLGHSDKDVRLLSACCIVDILRVFAPEAPYCDEEMVRVFEVIISQIRSLSTYDIGSATGSKVVYILDSLAIVKSCVVPVIMAQTGVQGAEDLMTSLFDALISVFRPDHAEDVSNHMCSILQACIEECDDIDQDLLDILLSPLLPAAKAENPTAYQCVGNVLRRTAGCIQASVSAFINHELVGTAIPGKSKNSELADHIYLLIYELHKISPGLLLRVLPNICVQLQAEEEEVRLKAVKLLGKLFASQHADYGSEFHRNFKDFLGRFVDVSAAIRLDMVDSCSAIIKSKPQHRAAIEEQLMKRLRDEDVDVRLGALSRLIELGIEHPDSLTVMTFREIGKRVSDRKLEVRKLAVIGLSRMYLKHVSSLLPPLSSFHDINNDKGKKINQDNVDHMAVFGMFEPFLRKDILNRTSFIPGYVVNMWGYTEMRPLIMQLLQENILPKTIATRNAVDSDSDNTPPIPDPVPTAQSRSNASKRLSVSNSAADLKAAEDINGCRASSLLLLYALLTPQERASFGTILGYKAKVRSELSIFLHVRSAALSPGASIKSQGMLKRSMKLLSITLPPPDRKTVLLEKLHSAKDKTVFRLLHCALAPKDSIAEACAHRDDLRQRLDSKSPLGEYIACLYDAASYKIANEGATAFLLNYTVSPYAAGSGSALTAVTSTLLTALAKHTPLAFRHSASMLNTWLNDCSDRCATANLNLSSSIAKKGKKQNSTATQGMLAAQTEVKDALFSFGQCVSTVRYIVQTAGVLGTDSPGTGTGQSMSKGGGDASISNVEASSELCRTLLHLASVQTSVELSTKLAEAATQLALFSEVSQDEEHSSNNNIKNNKRNTSSSSSSRSSHSDSGTSSGSGSRSISKAVVAAISKLSSVKNLSLSNSRLSLDLSVLSALVTVPATTTSTLDAKKLFISSSLYQAAISVKDRVLEFIKETVSVHGFDGIEDEDDIDEGHGGGRSASDIVCAALKLWTAFVTVTADSLNHQNKHTNKADEGSEDNVEDDNEENEEGGSDGNGSEESDMPEDVNELVHVLFKCIGCEGASVCGLELDGSVARLAVYESAALCAVECIRLCVVGRFLQVGYWHSLGWAFMASNDGMRRRLLGALNAVIQTSAVHPRFLAYPCLFATDDVLAPIAEQGLMFAVRRLRSTHDGLCGLAIEKNSDKLRALAEINMPETILPYVLHLLSYHPDFPTSSSIEDEADKRRLKGITKNLRMVTDTLLNSLQDDIGNLSFLLKQVNMISQHYEDSTDCENIGLNFVTILATKILSEKIKTQENVLAYPGDVRLPIELFQLRKGNAKRGQNVLEGLGDVDQAIEKVLKKGGRMAGNKRALGRNVLKSKSVSPKKRTQPSPKVKIVLDRLTNKDYNDNDDDEEDEENNGEKGGGSASRAKVTKKAKLSKARLPVEAPERVSSRLQRGGGRPSVSYEEKEESDDEMEGWEAAAAEISLSQSNRLSKGSGTGSGSGSGSGGRTGTGTGSTIESSSGLSGQKRNRKEADDENQESEESAKGESADDDDDYYDAAIKKTILKPKQSAASSSSSSSSSSARIATVNTKQFKNYPISKKEDDYSDRTESSPEKKDDASASPSQSPVSPLSPVVASSNNSPGKKENEHDKHAHGRVKQDEGEERSEEQSEEEEEEESSEDVRPNRRSKVQPKKPPSRSTATAKVSKPQEQKKAMPLTKDISNMPSRTIITADKTFKVTDNKKQKISDNKFFMKQNSETKPTAADNKKNDKIVSKVNSTSEVENTGRGRGRKPLAPTPPKRPILLRG